MKTPFLSKKRNVALVAIAYTFMWGCAFPIVKLCMDAFNVGAGDNMSKCLVAGVRFILSGIVTLLIHGFSHPGDKSPLGPQLKYIAAYGIFGTAIQYALTYIGLSTVDGSKGAVFDQLCVFIVILFSGLLFKNDKLTVTKLIGCAAGILGIVFINTDGLSFTFSFMGEGMMIGAALCQTAAYFTAKAAADKVAATKLVGGAQLLGGILLTVFSLCMGGRITTINLTAVITLLLLVGISSAAYVLSLMPLKYFPASEISVFNLLITVFGVVMSAVILGEDIWKINYLISLLLVSVGIIAVNYHRKERVHGSNI